MTDIAADRFALQDVMAAYAAGVDERDVKAVEPLLPARVQLTLDPNLIDCPCAFVA